MAHKTQIMYVELKSGFGDSGPAWISRVRFTKSGRGVYFKDKLLLRGSGLSGNFFDEETGEEYWVSGIKKNRQDRHWAGSGAVEVDEDIRSEYEALLAV
jgi:hypothetical protein